MMRFLFNIAAKNLTRNKLRASVSIGAIALSVALIIILRGFMMGITDSMVELHVKYDSGHIKIIDQEYNKKSRLLSLNNPVDGFSGEGAEAMARELSQMPGITQVVPRLRFGAATSNDDSLKGMLGWGVKPAEELAFTDLGRYLVEGRMLKEGTKEIVMGRGILEELNLTVGDKITLLFTTSFGSFKGATFNIVGKVDSKLKLLDDNVFFVSLTEAQNMLDMPDMVTEMLLITPNYRKVNQYFGTVEKYFAEHDPNGRYLVKPWDQTNPLIGMIKVADKLYNFVYLLLLILASFVVINTMIMIVKERTQEIGMMTALGLKSRDILYMFLMEGMVMGLIGSFLGTVIGGIGNQILGTIGIDYTEALKGVGAEILMRPVFYPVLSVENLVFCFILGVIVTIITCIIPARKAAGLEPTEALRR